MVYLDTILNYFGSNKKRTVLAVIGVAIGVFSLVLMMGITGAMKGKINKILGKLGDRVLIIIPGQIKTMGGHVFQLSFYTTLTLKDAQAIKQKCPGVALVSPFKEVHPFIHANGKYSNAKVFGVAPEYSEITNYVPLCGRFITPVDVRAISQAAVIGQTVAKDLFNQTCPVGKTVYLFDAPYKIVGVLQKKGTDLSGTDLDNVIFVPISSAVKRLENVDYIDAIFVLPKNGTDISSVSKNIESLLLKRHGKKDFTVNRYEDVVNTRKQAMRIFKVLGITVSAIAFSVGALGILAVMTLSVYERLIEIGIRRAFGATKLDIFVQFLAEATILSLSGSIAGAFLATLIVALVSKIAGWSLYIPYHGLAVAIGLSVFIGIVSGVYPAIRATSFEPKEILRDI